MKQKLSALAATVIVMAAALFTCITYYRDAVNEREIEIGRLTNAVTRLEDKLLKQVEAIRYTLPDSMTLTDTHKVATFLKDIAADGPHLVIYIDRMQCESCWQAELRGMQHHLKHTGALPRPLIMAANYNLREARLLAQRCATDIPLYLVNETEALQHIGRLRKPFYFVLEEGGTVASVYYPDEQSVESDSIYFNTVARKYGRRPALPVAASSGNTPKGVAFEQEKIDIGDIGMRKLKEVVFRLTNNSTETCEVHDIRMSCTCLMLKQMPQCVLPGETAEIKVNFLSTTKGRFTRTLELTLSTSTLPCTLTIQGNVV
ncbi:MAG: DUF1573 domain-containing protein [Clostridium sp.]|nr:DUF1573 domain-containing protein [Clostridium sp.]